MTSDAHGTVSEVEGKASGWHADRGTRLEEKKMFFAGGKQVVGIECDREVAPRLTRWVYSRVSERPSATDRVVAVIHVAGKLSDTCFDTSDSRFDC